MRILRFGAAAAVLIILAACAQLTPPASEAWQKIGIDEATHAEYSLNPATRVQQGDLVNFLGKITYPQTVTPPQSTGLPAYSTVVGTWQINCRTRTYTILKADFFDKQNHLLRSQTFEQPSVQSIRNNRSAIQHQYRLMCHTETPVSEEEKP